MSSFQFAYFLLHINYIFNLALENSLRLEENPTNFSFQDDQSGTLRDKVKDARPFDVKVNVGSSGYDASAPLQCPSTEFTAVEKVRTCEEGLEERNVNSECGILGGGFGSSERLLENLVPGVSFLPKPEPGHVGELIRTIQQQQRYQMELLYRLQQQLLSSSCNGTLPIATSLNFGDGGHPDFNTGYGLVPLPDSTDGVAGSTDPRSEKRLHSKELTSPDATEAPPGEGKRKTMLGKDSESTLKGESILKYVHLCVCVRGVCVRDSKK